MAHSVVFELRSEKLLDDAYRLAFKLYQNEPFDLQHAREFAWVLIDIILQRHQKLEYSIFNQYIAQLNDVIQTLSENNYLDENIQKNYQKVLGLFSQKAKVMGDVYTQNQQRYYEESLGWDLYHYCREQIQVLEQIQLKDDKYVKIAEIRQRLMQYLKLNNKRPSPLHSNMLQWVALPFLQLSEGNFHFAKFLKLWGLELFLPEDYQNLKNQHQPSLFHQAISASLNLILKYKDSALGKTFLPYLEIAIQHEPEYIWFAYYQAKIYLLLGDDEKAFDPALKLLKQNSSETSSWLLVANAQRGIDLEMSLACYCKAIHVAQNDDMINYVRNDMIQFLIENKLFNWAKSEIQLFSKTAPYEKVISWMESCWYNTVEPENQLSQIYLEKITLAENLLHQHLPWSPINAGHYYENKEQKKRLKIYMKKLEDEIPFEYGVSAHHFQNIENIHLGSYLLIKAELDANDRLKVYAVKEDDTEIQPDWSLFHKHIGVVSYVNMQKSVSHFTFDIPCDVFVQHEHLIHTFQYGETVSAGLAQRYFQDKLEYTAVNVQKTKQKANSTIFKEFRDSVQIKKELAFTIQSGVFITPNIVRNQQIKHDDMVQGTAVLNFNKKRNIWGWKAIHVEKI